MRTAIKSPVKSSRSPVNKIIPSNDSGRNSICSCLCGCYNFDIVEVGGSEDRITFAIMVVAGDDEQKHRNKASKKTQVTNGCC